MPEWRFRLLSRPIDDVQEESLPLRNFRAPRLHELVGTTQSRRGSVRALETRPGGVAIENRFSLAKRVDFGCLSGWVGRVLDILGLRE